MLEVPYTTVNITTAATTVVLKKPGIFGFVTINKADAHTISIYDDPAAANNPIGVIKASAAEGTYWFLTGTRRGLTIITAASFAGDITVGFRDMMGS